MKYCEKCKVLCEDDFCTKCNTTEIRSVNDDDFCLFFESGAEFGELFKETMESSGAVCVLVPYGDGTLSRLGVKIGYQVYVPYRYMDVAKNVYRILDSRPSKEDLRKKLLDNIENWFINSDKNLKKIIKKLKITKGADVFDFIIGFVKNADNVVFYRHINGFVESDRDAVCVTKGKASVWFDLETFEIIF